MASDIDDTFPRDNEQVEKSEMRAVFATIKAEVEALQNATNFARQIAFGTRTL